MQFIELLDVKLCMLGNHQLQNAATAACAALCLHNQGEDVFLCSIVLFYRALNLKKLPAIFEES